MSSSATPHGGSAETPESTERPIDAPVAVHPRRMLDRYEIIAEIARGGMGTVYLARLAGAGGFERLMALKLMHEHLAEDQAFVTMLLDEARTAAAIHHPNAVGIADVCESPVGYYLVMSYVDGFSLAHLLSHEHLSETARLRAGIRMIADAAHGLHAAHTAKNAKGERLGIVHRDVSPQNVLVGTDGVGRIIDFGIALAASRVATSRPGMLKGKPSYMAPEQARGDVCDARTDVFALGIMLWEILTNSRLFYADMDLATLVKVMECNVEPPTTRNPALPAALSDVAMKALSRTPEGRFASAREMAVQLERAADAAGLLADAHEVEALVAELFAEDIAAKQDAIAAHLASSTGALVQLQRGQLGTVPRLIARRSQLASAAPEAAAPRSSLSGVRTRQSRTPISQPVVTGDGSVDAAAATRASAHPTGSHATGAPSTERAHPSGLVSTEVAEPAPRSQAAVTRALFALALVLFAAAAAVWLARQDNAAEAAAVATPPPVVVPIAPMPPARVAVDPATVEPAALPPVAAEVPVAEPAAVAAEPIAAEPVAVQPVAVQPVATEAEREARSARRARAEQAEVPAEIAPTPEPVTAEPRERSAPQLETNPYLVH